MFGSQAEKRTERERESEKEREETKLPEGLMGKGLRSGEAISRINENAPRVESCVAPTVMPEGKSRTHRFFCGYHGGGKQQINIQYVHVTNL